MNQSLQKSLEKESSRELFYNFKHDGLLNFEKKIVSGIILHERNYSIHSLKREKSIIVNSINDQISDYKNSSKSAAKNRNKAKRAIILSVLSAIIGLLLLFKDYFFKPLEFSYSSLMIILFFVFTVGYSIYTYDKKVQRGIQADIDDCKLLEQKLIIIKREWDF